MNDPAINLKKYIESISYPRNETYNKTQTDTQIDNYNFLIIVDQLPTTNIRNNKIYLVLNDANLNDNAHNRYDFYIYTNNKWEQIDSLEFDIEDYYDKVQIDNALSGKADINHGHNRVTTTSDGFMTREDKSKLDTINPSDTNPLMDGTVSQGTSTKYSRQDHRHPSDTTKINKSDIQNNLTSTDTDKPLSAKQGKELKTLIDNKKETIVDDHLDANSTNPVQNRVIVSEFYTKDDIIDLLNNIETGQGRLLSITIDEVTGDLIVDDDGFEYYTETEADEKFTVEVVKQSTAETGFLSTYVIKQGGNIVGTKINIPKDFLVKRASIRTATEIDNPISGLNIGDKYIDFIINSKDSSSVDEHLYLKVSDIVNIDSKIDKKATAILANDDLDDYKNVGFYYSYDKNRTLTLSNIPDDLNTGFSLFVYGSRMSEGVENYVHQLLSTYNKDNPRLLVRTYSSAKQEWGEWIELFTKDSAIINTSNLVDGSVSTEKILNYAVTNDKLSSDAVTNGKLANDSVTNGKIKDGNITYNKLNTTLQAYLDSKLNTLSNKINANDDLNDYFINGFYSCNASSTAKTLVNYPSRIGYGGFGLLVTNNTINGLSNVNQIFLSYNNTNQRYLIRSYDSYHQAWSTWNELITDSKYILREKINHQDITIEIYSDLQNILIVFKGNITNLENPGLQLSKTIPTEYAPFEQYNSTIISLENMIYGVVYSDGVIKLIYNGSDTISDDIYGTIMYPLKERISNNLILNGSDGVGLNKQTLLTSTLAGNMENALVEFYEEYNQGIQLSSNKFILKGHNDESILTASLVDANDNSKIRQENVLIEFYEEYNISNVQLSDIPNTKYEDMITLNVMVTDNDGSKIEDELVEFFIEENNTENE